MNVPAVIIDVLASARQFLRMSRLVLGQHVEILEKLKAESKEYEFLLEMAERLSIEIEAAVASCRTLKKDLTNKLETATDIQNWQYEQVLAARNEAGSSTNEEEEAYRFLTEAMEQHRVHEREALKCISSLVEDIKELEVLYDRAVIMLNP